MLGKAKRNWFMGIRTPWTMSSDEVWDSTHRVSGRLFIDAGVTSLLGVVFPSISVYLLLASSIGAGVGSVAISYYYYAKLAPKNKQA
jgi:uncharacterized membrane protein